MNKKKIIISCIMLALLIILVLPVIKPLELTTSDKRFVYELHWNYVEITDYRGDETEVIVPDTILLRPVKVIGPGAFALYTNIVKVVLPKSVDTIKGSAFKECEELTEINISNVHSISSLAFEECKKLEKIEFSPSLETIEPDTFRACESLENVILPDKLKIIDEGAFIYCVKLKSISIPASIEKIGNSAFSGCTDLENVTIDQSVKRISANAFDETPWLAKQTDEFVLAGDSALIYYNGDESNVHIPTTAKSIGSKLFEYNNTNIKEIYIPAEVEYIDKNAFIYCKGLKQVHFEGKETDFDKDIFADEVKDALTIYAPTGSKAIEYAKENNYQYVEE